MKYFIKNLSLLIYKDVKIIKYTHYGSEKYNSVVGWK